MVQKTKLGSVKTNGNDRRARSLAILAAAALVVLVSTSGGYRSHCGRCADQKTEMKVLWITVATPEPHYDEYGIVTRWEKAHPNIGPCPNIWLAGPFDPDQPDPQYWPRLHLRVAAARRTKDVEALIRTASVTALRKTDVLGRTILHWLATHKRTPERDGLVAFLVEQGLSRNQRDADGLSPRDWASADPSTTPLGGP